jgi:hypothetical protein
MKNTLKVISLIAILAFVGIASNTHAQNWGFSLPSGAGFAINGKSWGFSLPGGGGFGINNGGWGGGGAYGGGRPGCGPFGGPFGGPPIAGATGTGYGAVYYPQTQGYGARAAVPCGPNWVRRGPRTSYTSQWVVYPNIW